MKAEIRRFHSPDIWDLSAHKPDDPEVFGFLLQVFAGPKNGSGEESFDVVVCSPRWLARELAEGIRWGRHHLVRNRYDWLSLEHFIRAQFEAVDGDTWQEVAEQLGRFARWEFEDYTP